MNYKREDNKQYMVGITDDYKTLISLLENSGYINHMDISKPVAMVIDNEHKWFYNVPGIFMFWKYSMGRKYPLTQLTTKDIINNFQKLIIELDVEFYNKLITRR